MRTRREPEPLVLTSEDVRSGRVVLDAAGKARTGGRHSSALQRTRRANGKAGEDLLAAHNLVCEHAGVAEVVKIGTEMRIVGMVSPGVYRAVFATPSGVDYRGHMLDGTARSVYVECKHVADPTERFPLSKVREVQREQLEAANAAGCVAALVIVLGPRRDLYAVPWWEARSRVSLGLAELEGWWVRPGDPYLGRFVAARGAR